MEVGASKIKKFKRALRRDPGSSEANFGLAVIYFKRGELVEALPYAEKASQMDPASADAKALLGSIYVALDRDAKAEECLAEAIKLNAGNYGPYSKLAEVRYRRNDIAGAAKVLEDAAELFPKNSQTFNDLGVMYYLRGDVAEAEKRFDKAREVNPKDRDALFNLSVIHLHRGKADRAVEALEQLVQVEPDRAAHNVSLGRAYQAAGNAEAAAKRFEKAIALNPDNAEAHYGLGANLLKLGQQDAAMKSLERCLELDPEHTGAIFAMIGCLAKKGQTDEIVKLWEKNVALAGRADKDRAAIQPKLSAGIDVAPVEVMEKIERRAAELAQDKVELSAVVPVLDETDAVRPFQDRLTRALESLGKPYEIVYVNDAGRDDILRVLRNINEGDDRVRVVNLARGYGHAAALSAGFDHARGEIIIAVDARLRCDPEGIRALIDKLAEGYDVVAGVPEVNGDPVSEKVRIFIANRITSMVAGMKVPGRGTGLAAYKRSVLDSLKLCGEMYRFVPVVAGTVGFATAEVPLRGAEAADDEPKPKPGPAPCPVLDTIATRFLSDTRTGPMRYFVKLGVYSIVKGIIVSILVAVLVSLAGGSMAWIALPIGVYALAAALLVTTGFVVEIVLRAYRHSQNKPTYIVKEIVE
jgi:tetratricopeptide (TPR) repeat protein/glycosyltransferase involved in cell wall biosynthesis